jgi:hypothetical protein
MSNSHVRMSRGRKFGALLVASLFGASLCRDVQSAANPWDEPQEATEAISSPDLYAWKLFVALNWPADAAQRRADSTKPFGENSMTVWESWKLSSGRKNEVFLAGGADPGEWLPGSPAGPRRVQDFESMPLQQSPRFRSGRARPQFDPNTSPFGRNENHLNRAAYEFIRAHELYNVDGQEKALNIAQDVFAKALSEGRAVDAREYKMNFPLAAKEVKAQWRTIPEADKPRYRWVEFVDSTGARKVFGLTALHITTKDLPNWLWATFEHVDNPSRDGAEAWMLPTRDTAAGRKGFPDGMGIEGTRWENYRLRGTQTEFVNSVGETTRLANSQIEQGFQTSASCITCHARAAIGRRIGADETANRLPIFEHEYPPTVVGSVGMLEESLFVRRTAENPVPGTLDYLQLDFVWSLSRAVRKTAP